MRQMVKSVSSLAGPQLAAAFCARAATMTDEDLLEELGRKGSEAHTAFVECAPYWERETRRRVAGLVTKRLVAAGLGPTDLLGATDILGIGPTGNDG
jgi:hypothetical protein